MESRLRALPVLTILALVGFVFATSAGAEDAKLQYFTNKKNGRVVFLSNTKTAPLRAFQKKQK